MAPHAGIARWLIIATMSALSPQLKKTAQGYSRSATVISALLISGSPPTLALAELPAVLVLHAGTAKSWTAVVMWDHTQHSQLIPTANDSSHTPTRLTPRSSLPSATFRIVHRWLDTPRTT